MPPRTTQRSAGTRSSSGWRAFLAPPVARVYSIAGRHPGERVRRHTDRELARTVDVAGAYFFVRVALETRWHRVHVGFLPVTAFTLFMAIGTFNHLDDFKTAHVAFWIWVWLYVITPVLVPLAWWRNRATDPGTPESGEPALPGFARPLLISVGAAQSAVALVLLLSPSTMIAHWPWDPDPADGADARGMLH
jgi:hypothetical protein